jgi:hypothetical protein
MNEVIEAGLSKLLTEAPDVPLANFGGLLNAVLRLEGRAVFSQLIETAARSVISSYVTDGVNTPEGQAFLNHPSAISWLQNVPSHQLSAILAKGYHSGPPGVARAWKWISDAPAALYRRQPSVLPELCSALMPYVRRSFPEGMERSLEQVLKRSRSESGSEVRQVLSAEMLRFAFDNISLPLSAVVAEAFADVYSLAIVQNSRPPSFLSVLFGSYDWDRGKDLRISLIDSFVRSNWAPGDLAVAANNAGILRKIFKRLRRKYRGDDYVRSMMQDLARRSDSDALQAGENLKKLVAAPDFYEEWD